MKLSELRINNWIHFDNLMGDAIDLKVTPRFIRSFSIHLADPQGDFEISNYYKPIKLTENWLLEFGFSVIEKDGNMGSYKVYSKGLIVFNTSHGWWFNVCQIRNIEYVHQLQNLFFALTGKEL